MCQTCVRTVLTEMFISSATSLYKQAAGEPLQHTLLHGRKFRGGIAGRRLPKCGHHFARDLAGHGSAAGMEFADGFQEFRGRSFLEEITGSSRGEGAENQIMILKDRQHHELSFGQNAAQLGHAFDAGNDLGNWISISTMSGCRPGRSLKRLDAGGTCGHARKAGRRVQQLPAGFRGPPGDLPPRPPGSMPDFASCLVVLWWTLGHQTAIGFNVCCWYSSAS